jgi:cell wall-associated NlpC family hydrolase
MPRPSARTAGSPFAQRVASSGAMLTTFSLTLATSAAVGAQQGTIRSPFSLETFAARSESRSAALFGGLSLTGFSGSWGVRMSTALSGLRSNDGDQYYVPSRNCSRRGCSPYYGGGNYSSGPSVNAWSADVDLIAQPFRQLPLLRQALLGFSPYGFVGIGHYNVNAASLLNRDTSRAVWSYGLGVQHDVIGPVGFMAEARARRAVNDNSFVGGTFRDAIQYRTGLSLAFGGAPKRKAPPPRVIYRGPSSGRGPVSTRPSLPPPPAPSSGEIAAAADVIPRLLDDAESLLNTPWRAGGTTPDQGFDAGGFVQYLFAQQNIALPRLVRDLAQTGGFVAARPADMRAGDLLFFSTDGNMPPDHVAIYAGQDRFVHASATGNGVLYDTFGDGARGTWFRMHLVAVRRVVGSRNSDVRVPLPPSTPSGRPDGAPRPAEDR